MPQSSPSARTSLLVALLALALVGSAPVSAAGTAVAQERVTVETAPEVAPLDFAQQTTPIPTNNSSLRHRNPDEVASENRLEELQGLLGSRLADRLSESSVQLSEEQYDQARSVLGEAYLDQLGKYGDVAGERGDDNATSAAETFNETRDTQREYSETVEEFRETVDEYQEAKANGNDARARQLAREAVDLGLQAARQAERLNGGYSRLERLSGADLDTAQTRIQRVQADIDTDRTEIESAEFVSTTLEVRVADTQGSFTNPFELTGTLESEDGPVSDRQIRLRVGPRTTTVRTDSDGDFALTYRPVVVPANASELTVQYVPRDLSVFSQSNATVSVQVQQVTGRASLETATTDTAFTEPVVARGSLTVAEVPVTGLPLAVTVGGARIGTVQTGANGSFDFDGSLPATTAQGDLSLGVTAAQSGRAVAVEPVESAVRVRETSTELSATLAEGSSSGNATSIAGTLTAAGQPIPDQRVVVTVGGERVGTARMNAQGAYLVRVDGESGVATVTFNETGTNLAAATATVTLPTGDDSETTATDDENATADGAGGAGGLGEGVGEFISRLQSDPLAVLTSPIGLVVSSLVVGALGLVALIVLRRRREGADTTSETATASVANSDPASEPDSAVSEQTGATPVDPLAAAVAALNDGTTDDAVIGAYAVIRQTFASAVADGRARTHWQFFDACVAAGVDAEPLRTITEAYEKARYGSDAPSTTAAEAALEAARSLVSDDGSDAAESVAPGDD